MIAKYVEKTAWPGHAVDRRRRSDDGLDTIERAIKDIAAGRPVIVVDDEDRENEGDLIFAAEQATPELVAFMVRYTSGYICVPLTEDEADRLDLPPMYHTNQDRRGTAYTVTVDAREGVTTGISAADRAHTIRLLADPADRRRPTCPARATSCRCGPRRAACCAGPGTPRPPIDLARLAGLRPAGVLCEMVNDDGTMMRLPDLEAFAAEHDLALITHRRPDRVPAAHREAGRAGRRGPAARPSTASSPPSATDALLDGAEHVALVYGDLGDGEDVLVRVHSECLTGDVFGSLRCDCGPQLDAALERVAAEGRGRRALHARARGPRHRPAAQAAGLPAAGRGRGHRRRQPGARPARRRPRLRHRRADPRTTWACARCGCSPTTRPSGPGWRGTG